MHRTDPNRNGSAAHPHEPAEPPAATWSRFETHLMMRERVMMRLFEIALIPLDDGSVSPTQVRRIDASRKACVDLLRAVEREEERVVALSRAASARDACAGRDEPAGHDEEDDDDGDDDDGCSIERAPLRRGDTEILADLLGDEELEELGALATLIHRPLNESSGAHQGNGRGVRECDRESGAMNRAGPP